MTKKDKRFSLWLKDKNFASNKLKNIEISICHSSSTVALYNNCYFCDAGLTAKERKELKNKHGIQYGIRLGDFENKRHRHKRKPEPYNYAEPREFLKNVCCECIKELEDELNFKFEKSFAP